MCLIYFNKTLRICFFALCCTFCMGAGNAFESVRIVQDTVTHKVYERILLNNVGLLFGRELDKISIRRGEDKTTIILVGLSGQAAFSIDFYNSRQSCNKLALSSCHNRFISEFSEKVNGILSLNDLQIIDKDYYLKIQTLIPSNTKEIKYGVSYILFTGSTLDKKDYFTEASISNDERDILVTLVANNEIVTRFNKLAFNMKQNDSSKENEFGKKFMSFIDEKLEPSERKLETLCLLNPSTVKYFSDSYEQAVSCKKEK